MREFVPGLEGVVAFETQIAEPDRDGGALRYRGVDVADPRGLRVFRQCLGAAGRWRVQPGDTAGGTIPDTDSFRGRSRGCSIRHRDARSRLGFATNSRYR